MRVVRAGGALPAKAEIRHVQFITALFLIMALVLLAGRSPRAETMRLKDVESGTLLLRGANAEPGAFIAAPMVKTHVRMEVSGLIARVTMSQIFLNPSDERIEGVYVFPLPENAAEKDFVLEWLPEAERGPATALFAEALENATYALITVVPPRERQSDRPRLPREINDITDTSGSMEGPSIRHEGSAPSCARPPRTP
jgi:hypothetical protein